MRGNGRGSCKLCIGMHTSQRIRKAVGSGTCCHIVRMQGTSCTAAGSNGEIFLAGFGSLLFICTCHRMLESGRIGGVTGNGNVHILFPHNGNAFRNTVGSIAVYFGTKSLGIRNSLQFLYLIGIRIILCLHKSETVYTGNDLCRILSKSVQDYAKRFLANLVSLLRNTDSALCSCKRLMSCQEAEAVGLLFQKHFAKIAMSQSYLTGVGNGSRNTECLKSFSDSGSGVCSLAAVFLDGNSSANRISPARVLKTDGLNLLHLLIYVKAGIFGNLLCFFDRGDTIAVQYFGNFINTSFI